jgi:hypothetical protein
MAKAKKGNANNIAANEAAEFLKKTGGVSKKLRARKNPPAAAVPKVLIFLLRAELLPIGPVWFIWLPCSDAIFVQPKKKAAPKKKAEKKAEAPADEKSS